MTVALCLLTWNEIDGVHHDVPLIDKSKFDQIYCIDGGSTDGTVEFLEDEGIAVYRQTAKGLNQACWDGAERCTCDAFVFYHPKGTVPVADTYRFRSYFEEGYEFVVARRNMKGARNEEDSRLIRPRKWFVQCVGLAARILFKREGNTVWDALHGFRGMTRAAFLAMPKTDGKCTIDIEMVCQSYKQKTKRIEFPTTESTRLGGVMATLTFFKDSYWYNTMLAFPFGMFYSQKRNMINQFVRNHYWTALVASLMAVIGIHVLTHFIPLPGGDLWFSAKAIAFSLLLVCLMMRFELRSRPLTWCGKNLFELYIYQRLPMIALVTLAPAWVAGNCSAFVWASFAITASLIVGWKWLADRFSFA